MKIFLVSELVHEYTLPVIAFDTYKKAKTWAEKNLSFDRSDIKEIPFNKKEFRYEDSDK